MRQKAIWVLCALALGAFALGAAGCGGGGTTTVTVAADTTSTDTTSTDTTSTDTTETTDDGPRPTRRDDTTDRHDVDATPTSTDTGTTTSPDLSFISNENCRQFVKFASDFSQALSGTGDTDIQGAADELQKFADEAPDEIRDDFKMLADVLLEDRRRPRRRRPELGQDAVGGRDREAGPALAGDRHDQGDRGEHEHHQLDAAELHQRVAREDVNESTGSGSDLEPLLGFASHARLRRAVAGMRDRRARAVPALFGL